MSASPSRARVFGAGAFAAVLAVAASGAPPVPTQQATLTPSDPADYDYFGDSVGVSGGTAVVGTSNKDDARGAAYVFERTGTDWAQAAKLTASDGANYEQFGFATAIDGDTLVVGSHSHASSRGAVYVFTRTGTAWVQQAKLTASDAVNGDALGYSVAISGDTVVAGAYWRDARRGAAYVFRRTGTAWAQEATLTSSDSTTNDVFGYAVGLSGDTAVVGAPWKDSNQGAAYVFARTGNAWTEQGKLTASDGAADDALGIAAAVSGDTAVVGSYFNDAGRGAAYVFGRTGASWTQQAKLTAADAAPDNHLGAALALPDGTSVVAGAPDVGGGHGAVYLFKRSGTTWTQDARLTAGNTGNWGRFGGAVAVSGDTVVAAASAQDSGRGAAYVFALTPAVDATSGCLVAAAVKAKANAKHPEKSALTASGLLDTGEGPADFSGAATFDAGGFRLDVPAFVAKGKSLTYAAGGISLSITPAKNASSHATFSVKAVGDLAGKVVRDGPLSFRFRNAAHDVSGTATLANGALAPHGVTEPALAVLSAAATLRGGGADSLKLTLTFATDGVVPAAAEDLTIGFGDRYTSTPLAGASFVRKRSAYVFTAKAPGITKATVDYGRGTITIAGADLELGEFADGGNDVDVTITRGAATRTALIRVFVSGAKLVY